MPLEDFIGRRQPTPAEMARMGQAHGNLVAAFDAALAEKQARG